ncbi:MAG: hypothetical protein H6765_04625 [Candidatus Peribacteria bacterium]|nr:MAG: hypothetical protein H6765_04625 [Candidatus Peribacteria bacterium]
MYEYFEQHKHESLENQDKLMIYQAFLSKSQRVLYLRKVRYYTRLTSFALGLGLVCVLGYVAFQPTQQSGYQVAQVGDAIITLE